MLVHGYPPREQAGTENHTQTLAHGLRTNGHTVHIVSATRAPGDEQYSVWEEPGITRIVNNITVRPLGQCEKDPVIDSIIEEKAAEFEPDVVHIQHLQFLSAGFKLDVPAVITLHDGWLWCAAGGTEILPNGTLCPHPSPTLCADCASHWTPIITQRGQRLVDLAGHLSPWVPADRLHALYKRSPQALKTWVSRSPTQAPRTPKSSPKAAEARNQTMLQLAQNAAVRIAPSQFLADKAERMGLGKVMAIPHGVDQKLESSHKQSHRSGLLFLGTIGAHKGPDLVVDAWKRAFPNQVAPTTGAPVPLSLHGDVSQSSLANGHPIGRRLNRSEVQKALSNAQALVMGSRWPENAPMVIVEARAAQCPVIAPNIGGIPELIEEGVDGWLYPMGDSQALAEAMISAVSSPLSSVRPPPHLQTQVDATVKAYRTAQGQQP